MNKIYHCLLSKFSHDCVSEVGNAVNVYIGQHEQVKYFGKVTNDRKICVYNSLGKEYKDKVNEYVKLAYENSMDKYSVPAFVMSEFKSDIFDDAGFVSDDDIDDNYNIQSDPFWEVLRGIATINRKLEIYTYGIKFKQFKNYSKTDCNFNALVITGSKMGNLHKIRGTNPELQKRVRSGNRFEEVMLNIVKTVEEKDYHSIGIYCRAGHHRSVACGELLKKFVYTDSTVKHLTIYK